MPQLFVYPKNREAFQFSLGREKLTLGRSEENTIFLPDPFCSGKHAVLSFTGSGYAIRDCNSKNGTFVNGKRIQGEVTLNKGDEILIGSTRMVFDKELSTNVEVTDVESSAGNIHTILHLDDVLKKSEVDTTIRAASRDLDLDRIRTEHRSFSVISEVSKALVLHRPLGELLNHIMDLIGENLPMDRGILMLKEGNPLQLYPKVVRIYNKKLMDQRILVSQSIVNVVMEKLSSVLVSDVQTDPRFKSRDSILKMNIHSAMCVPLWNNEEIIGIVYADRISLLKPFTDEDLKLMTLLANLAAVKIENARRLQDSIEKEKMEKELELAAQIQKDFLPRETPSFPGFEIAGDTLPCYQVGGDYFDYFPVEAHRLGVVVADVSGKGVGASLLMASLRAALHAEIHPQYDIQKMASKLNDFVHRSSSPNSFITFFYGELNRKTGELRYVNAGHNPPLVLGRKGRVRRLESTGFCLGMFPSGEYPERSITLQPGETVVLFTDGMTECRDKENRPFEEEKLVEILQECCGRMGARELLEKVYAEIASYTKGMDRMDDMTLVVIKRIPEFA